MGRRWLNWRLRRAERRWYAVNEELRAATIAVSPSRIDRLYWLRDVVLAERIQHLRALLSDTKEGSDG